jgi:hypothetical protein
VRNKVLLGGLILIGPLFCSNVSGSHDLRVAQACFDVLNDNARNIIGGPYYQNGSVSWVEWRGGYHAGEQGSQIFEGDTLNSACSVAEDSIQVPDFVQAYNQGIQAGLNQITIDTTYDMTQVPLDRGNNASGTLATLKQGFREMGVTVGLQDGLEYENNPSITNMILIGLGSACLLGAGFFVIRSILRKYS